MKKARILHPLTIAICCGFFTTANSMSGQTWTQTSAPTNNWVSIASSADGTRLVAAASFSAIYISTNSGSTWMQTSAPTNRWLSVASSADGTRLIAAAYNYPIYCPIYTSSDSGATWMTNNAPAANWKSVACSADGTRLAATVGTIGVTPNIFLSATSGASWFSNNVPSNGKPFDIIISANGAKLFAVPGYGGFIYTSTDSGTTWVTNDAPSTGSYTIASSADGTKLVAALPLNIGPPLTGAIYTSTNSGASWYSNNVPAKNWFSVASSADGTRLIAASYTNIYTSPNSGTTWVSNGMPKVDTFNLVVSADGNRLVAAVIKMGGIWTCRSTPSPQMNLNPVGNNLNLSWTVPSVDFVLQQSSDLSGWANVTNPPVLNLTNLQNEVILSPASGSAFYRLKTP